MRKFPVSDIISQFSDVFYKNGHSLYIVGGAVRDFLLGIENSDFDFCTDALPEEVMKMFSHVIPTGIKHGTVTVLFKNESYEVTTFRTETDYSDKRHPDNVEFVTSLEEDLSRRDFTVNAFAADCRDGKIIDLFNGLEDLKNKKIKAIGNPDERFSEDALRLLRMCRFSAKLGFETEKKTFESAVRLASSIKYVSKERIFEEIDKTLSYSKPSAGLNLMLECGLFKYIIPDLEKCSKTKQNKINSDNVFTHIVNAVDAAALHSYNQTVRWALLLHDVGKPDCMQQNENFIRFFGHDVKSAQLAVEILKDLKCSNYLTDTCKILIENHMVKYNRDWTDGAVKRFINRVGKENINMLFEVQWCDQIASEGKSKEQEYDEFIHRIAVLSNEPLTVKDLAVCGNDLAEIGIPKNKEMGVILNRLLEMVIDYPSLNEKETLLRIAASHRQA